MIAYVDESARAGPEGVYYLVTAGVIVAVDPEQARRTLVKLRPLGGRFHWYRERQQGRMAMLDAMAELGTAAFVIWSYPVGRKRQEPARERCMTALLANLDREGIHQVVIERREDRGLNRADRRTIHDARQAGLVSESFSYRFEAPKEEPLLWVPDAIAGAVGMHLANKAHDYFDRLGTDSLTLTVRRAL